MRQCVPLSKTCCFSPGSFPAILFLLTPRQNEVFPFVFPPLGGTRCPWKVYQNEISSVGAGFSTEKASLENYGDDPLESRR